ncbi:MAG TPA: hypothetical protein VJN22_00505 [Candidatus Eremiobacteraceae bacterium]|nr:hypothetical protein [Candidatus Eremiobacteraceae bacterium]
MTRDMMHFLVRLCSTRMLVAAAAACVVLAPLSTVSAQGLPFKPPKGWVPVKVPASLIGKWVNPGNDEFHQSVSVYAHTYHGTLSDYYAIDVSSLKSHYPGGDIAVSQDTTVCGGHPAKYVSYGLNTSAGPLIVEQVMSVQKDVAYVVTYVRLASQNSDPAARQSLTTICGI